MDSFAMIALILVFIGFFLYCRISSSTRKCCVKVMDVELPVKIKEPAKQRKQSGGKKKRVYKRRRKK